MFDVVPVDGESFHEPVGVDGIAGHPLLELILGVRSLLRDAGVLFQIPAAERMTSRIPDEIGQKNPKESTTYWRMELSFISDWLSNCSRTLTTWRSSRKAPLKSDDAVNTSLRTWAAADSRIRRTTGKCHGVFSVGAISDPAKNQSQTPSITILNNEQSAPKSN